MARIYVYFSILLPSILFGVCIQCSDEHIEFFKRNLHLFNFEQITNDLFSLSDVNISKTISESNNQHSNCLVELKDIKNGLLNFEEWAVKIVDAWGKVPSGVLSGNFFEFGEFSQCFHIQRNGKAYKTQYCMGNFLFNSRELIASMENKLYMEVPDNFPRLSDGPGISIGICLPASCSVEHLEPIVNEVIQSKTNSVSFRIAKNRCQFEESASQLRTLDLVTIGLLSMILLLIAMSTSYDVFCTKNNRNKHQPFLAFSFYTNGKKLFSLQTSDSSDVMNCLHGIRALSTQWVVMGHTCLLYGLFPIRNKALTLSFVANYRSMIIASAPISVDTFFVMSGLLVSINVLKYLEKNGKVNVLMLYLHRYLRLTPLVCAMVLVSVSLFRFVGNGPLWPTSMEYLREPCEQYWWSMLLYIQNYVNPSDICLMHTWYLSVDMQLYFIAPLIIYLLYRFKIKALMAFVILLLGCIGCTLAVHEKYQLKSLRANGKMEKAYFPTHIRFSSWLIGVIAGYVLFKTRNSSICIPKILNLFAWAISITLMNIVIFANYPLQQLDSKSLPIEFGLYDALSRIAWSIALCYIIFACVHNSGGPINWFLSHPFWQPISKLCYSIYLLHVPVVIFMGATMKTPPHFSEFGSLQDFIAIYTLTVLVSIIASLAFESPIIIITKSILVDKLFPSPFIKSYSNNTNTQNATDTKQKQM